ncbi:MAG: sulfotransferase family protein [Desulfonatronovibrionaceae bacterium]
MKVFICGVGRSGTTYLKELLNSHPDVFIPTESLFLVDYLRYQHKIPIGYLSFLFFKEPQLRSWYKGRPFSFNCIEEAIDQVHKQAMEDKGASFWGQKTPRFIRHVELLNSAYDDLKWVFIYRDPRAVVASMLASKRHTYSVKRACKRWLKDNAPIVSRLENRCGKNEKIIKYEEFVRDFEEQLEELLAYLNLKPVSVEGLEENFSPTIYVYSNAKFKVNTVRNGLRPDKSRIFSFQNRLNRWQMRLVEFYCKNLMARMGYACQYESDSISKLDKVRDWVAGLKDILILFQYLLKWPSYLVVTFIRKSSFFLLSRITR